MIRGCALCSALVACAAPPPGEAQIAHLGTGDLAGVREIAVAFETRNPGYRLSWHPGLRRLDACRETRAVFVQRGAATATVTASSPIGVGDLVLLRPGESLTTDRRIDALVFTMPDPAPADVPTFLRPDWDPGITDTPGGCATEEGAYRRVVLTWLRRKGPYNCRSLNAHRVRIVDSFTHYHPIEGGFDEFYLVQMARPGARIITSNETARIIDPESVTEAEVAGLLREIPLVAGDLVYLPRGVVHRGLGGVLAHVITVPGFVPGSEIGVDHHLRRINERLGLVGDRALPLHAAASGGPVVR